MKTGRVNVVNSIFGYFLGRKELPRLSNQSDMPRVVVFYERAHLLMTTQGAMIKECLSLKSCNSVRRKSSKGAKTKNTSLQCSLAVADLRVRCRVLRLFVVFSKILTNRFRSKFFIRFRTEGRVGSEVYFLCHNFLGPL